MCKRIFPALILVLLITLFIGNVAKAHRLYVDVADAKMQVEIEIEAYYGDGKPARNADVTVYKPNDEVILTDKTDDNGRFKFKLNDTIGFENLTIVVEQVGHKAETKINIIGGSVADAQEGDEMPIYVSVIAGFGYLLGLAGFTSLYIARKHERGGIREK